MLALYSRKDRAGNRCAGHHAVTPVALPAAVLAPNLFLVLLLAPVCAACSGPALADGVYRPVWQLLAGLQSVLDSCDQQEQEWVRAKGQAAAAALEAAYEAHEAAAGGAGSSAAPWSSSPAACADSTPARPHDKAAGTQQQSKGATTHFAAEAAAAAAAEGVVLKHCEQCLQGLQQAAEQLAADLAVKKEEATAAAGGRGAAPSVAEGAAKLLKPMLKALRREGKDAHKLRRRLEAAAEATDAAAASASAIADSAAQSVLTLQKTLLCHSDKDASSSSSSSSSSNSSSSDDADSDVDASTTNSGGGGSRRTRARRQLKLEQHVLAAAEQQQQQQGARLQRLQSASQVLLELDKAAGKLETQMQEAQQRLQDMAAAGGGASVAGSHHDNGLVAAGTAGLAASLSASVRAFHATANNLGHLIQSLQEVAAAAAADASRVSETGRSTDAGSKQQQQHQQRHPRGSSLFSSPLSTPRGEHLSVTCGGGAGSASKLLGSRLGDAALAGTWGVIGAAAAAASAGGASQLLSPRAGSDLLQPPSTGGGAYDAASHYLIGAAAATTAGRSTAGSSSVSRGGLALSVNPQAAVAAAEGWRVLRSATSSPRGLSLGSKAAFAEQLQGAAAAGTGGPAAVFGISSGGVSGGTSPRGADTAAEAVHAVHAQLAGLSRQASRLSLKANAILAAGGGGSDAGGVRVGLSGSSSLAGSLRQREGPLTAAVTGTASPFSTTQTSPRGFSGLDATSPRAGVAGLGGLGGAGSAFGSTDSSPVPGSPRSGSLLSSATRSLLLSGQSARSLGQIPSAAVGGSGTRPALNLNSSFSGPLLRGGGLGGLGGGSTSSLGGLGSGVGLLRSAGVGPRKPYAAGVAAAPGVGLGSSSSLAAISSRLQSLANGGR